MRVILRVLGTFGLIGLGIVLGAVNGIAFARGQYDYGRFFLGIFLGGVSGCVLALVLLVGGVQTSRLRVLIPVAYVGLAVATAAIGFAFVSGPALRQSEVGSTEHWQPAWSPDGSRLAYTSYYTDGYGSRTRRVLELSAAVGYCGDC